MLSAAATAAAGGDLSVSSDFGREHSGQGGASISASMPLISQLESTFQTGRRLTAPFVLVLLLMFTFILDLSGTIAPQKVAASLRDAAARAFLCDFNS